jgi:serine protease Do
VQSKALAMSRPAIPAPLGALWALVLGLAFLLAQAAAVEARAAPESFADLADQVSPAVVNITTSTIIATPTNPLPNLPEGSPFDDFFRDFGLPGPGPGPGPGPSQRSQALGSGFVVSEDGYIVTNNHVIEGADEIEIEFFSGKRLPAKVVGIDPNTDIALLKVEAEAALPFVSFGNSDIVRVGDWVMAMGNPLGQGFSVSAGIVSARNRELSGTYDDYIQTDAAINRGNSGGPLFNMDGEVIGVNTAILSPNGGSIGIGFAMSSSVVTDVVDQLRQFGETRRGWLGVRIQDVTPEIAEAIGLDEPKGALVTDVPEGPALAAGVEQGDVIVMFDDHEVSDTRDLVRQVAAAEVGKEVPVVVYREGGTQTLRITLGRREEAEGVAPAEEPQKQPTEAELLGLTVSVVTPELRQQLGLPENSTGLVVTDVDAASEAYEKGVRAGDVITEAGQQAVVAPADLEARIQEARDAGRKSLLLLVRRGGEPRFVALSVD